MSARFGDVNGPPHCLFVLSISALWGRKALRRCLCSREWCEPVAMAMLEALRIGLVDCANGFGSVFDQKSDGHVKAKRFECRRVSATHR